MKKNNLLICESHQIIDSYHVLSEPEMKLIQLTLARHYQGAGVNSEIFYEVPLEEYAEWFGLTTNAAYLALVDACKLLKTRTLILKTALIDSEAPDRKKSIIGWVDRVDYNPITSKVEIRWDRSIVQLLNNYGKDNLYSKYLLDNTNKMTSVHSIRLYRVLNKWAKAGKLKRDLDEVRRLIGLEEGTYTGFDNFRRKVLDKGVSEINKYIDLEVEYAIITKGRKVVGLDFKIGKK